MIRLSVPQAQQLLGVLRDLGDHAEAQDLVRRLEHQLAHPSHDKDLIDTIAQALANPPGSGRGANILSGSRLGLLREAIFSPRELHAFKQQKGFACASCGELMFSDELATVRGDVVVCALCIQPSVVGCVNRGHKVELGKGLANLLHRHWKGCPVCAGINNGELRPGEPIRGQSIFGENEPEQPSMPNPAVAAIRNRRRDQEREAALIAAERAEQRERDQMRGIQGVPVPGPGQPFTPRRNPLILSREEAEQRQADQNELGNLRPAFINENGTFASVDIEAAPGVAAPGTFRTISTPASDAGNRWVDFFTTPEGAAATTAGATNQQTEGTPIGVGTGVPNANPDNGGTPTASGGGVTWSAQRTAAALNPNGWAGITPPTDWD